MAFGPKFFKDFPVGIGSEKSSKDVSESHNWIEVKLFNFNAEDCSNCGLKKRGFRKKPRPYL